MNVLAYGLDEATAARVSAAAAGSGGCFLHPEGIDDLRRVSKDSKPDLALVACDAYDWQTARSVLQTRPDCRVVMVAASSFEREPGLGACLEKPLAPEALAMLMRPPARERNVERLRPERVADRYQIVSEIGSGHVGRVYRARDAAANGRTVALKILPLPRTEPSASRARVRCQREAAALAATDHPVIVKLYDAGEWEDSFYLAAEMVRGITLDTIVKRNLSLSTELLLKVAEDLASAIVHLENLDIVHRDLKPANVMLSDEGRIRLVDFGLAKEMEDGSAATAAGDLRGTPHFIAPESITEDGELDSRSDVYSLGVTLFFLSTGEYPFSGGTVMDVLSAHLYQEAPALNVSGPERPEQLAQLVAAMLVKDPAKRPRPRQVYAQAVAARHAFLLSADEQTD